MMRSARKWATVNFVVVVVVVIFVVVVVDATRVPFSLPSLRQPCDLSPSQCERRARNLLVKKETFNTAPARRRLGSARSDPAASSRYAHSRRPSATLNTPLAVASPVGRSSVHVQIIFLLLKTSSVSSLDSFTASLDQQ